MKTKPAFRLSFPLASAIAALIAAPSAMAQNARFWDPAGPGNFGSVNGSITWTSPLNLIWTNSNTGASTRLGTFTTSFTDDCNFGGPIASLGVDTTTPGTTDVIPVSTVDAGTLSFNTLGNNLTLSGGTITLKAASSITTVNASQSHRISSVLAGAATSLTKAGAGTLILSGASTYAGATIINAGTLNLGGATANGSLASPTLTLGGGAFSYTRTGSTTQGFTTTNINSGRATQISVVSGNTLNLGTVVRGAGGAIDFSTTGLGTVAALLASNTNGIMAGLTFGNTWAVANGPGVAISGLGSYTLTSVAGPTGSNYTGANMDVDSSEGLIDAAITTNSLRFSEADANTMTLATGPNTITTGGILVNSTVGSNLSTITGGTLTGVANGDLALIQNNTSGGLTISSGIVNTTLTSITKSGAGLLTLGGNNTFTGGLTVNGGQVLLNNAGALNSTTPNNVTFGSGAIGTLTLNGNNLTIPVLNTNAAVPGTTVIENANVGNVTLSINSASSSTFAGVVRDGTGGGTLALTKAGAGTLTLSGANTYSGGTTLTAGTVAISNATSFGASTGAVTVTGASRINATGGITYANDINVGTQTLTMQNPAISASSTATFSGVLSGSGIISLPNSGTNGIQGIIAFTNTANTFTGNVVLSTTSSGDEFFSFNSIGDAGNFTIQKNGNRQGIIYAGSTDIVFGTRQIVLGTTLNTVTDGGGANPTNSFQNNGSGTVTFNTDIVPTTVGGTTATLFFGGSNADNNTFAGIINNTTSGNPLAIGKFGAGTWILSGANTYAGTTFIGSGILSVNAIAPIATAQPLGRGSLIQFSVGNSGTSGTLVFTGGSNSTTDKQVLIGTTTAGSAGSGSILNNGGGTLSFTNATFNPTITGVTTTRTLTLGGTNAGANTISGIIQNNNGATGTVALTKSGAGIWKLTGNNAYTGGTTLAINGGILAISHASGLGTGTVHNGTTNSAVSQSTLQLDFTVPVSGPGSSAVDPNVIANNFTFNSQNLLASGGFANIQNASGFNRISGTLTISGTGGSGANIVSDSGHLELAGNLTTTQTGVRAFNLGGAGDGTVSGIISNGTATVPVTKSGTGIWTLTNTNTYTGTTSVNGGTLVLSSTASIATSSAVTIGAAGILDTDAQATYAIPALQPLTFGINPAGSGSSGRIAADGLDITNAVVTLNPAATLDDPVYVLATYTAGSLTGAAFAAPLPTVPSGYELDYDYEGNKIALVATGGTPYQTWSGGAAFDADTNGDGVDNGLAFLLGAANVNVSALDKLPNVTQSGGNLILTFNCLPTAARGSATLRVEHSSDLGILDAWTATTAVVPDATNAVPDNNVTFVVGAGPVGPPALNSVTATIDSAAAAGAKLFGRLKATE